jgi:NhaP-type Na+/H+ or K+/H+ antiporter
MEGFNQEAFVAILALVGLVIVVAALASGLVERSNVPQVAVFLALGAVLGPAGLGLLNITLESPALRVVATLSLALVLFTDALTLDIREVRRQVRLALRVLGPGTLLSAALVALAAWGILGLPPALAAIIGAALASTDPVLLRGLVRRRDLSSAVRQALRLESGLNDVVLLPVVLVAMAFAAPSGGPPDWGHLALNLFLLGPGAGVAVGLVAVATLDLIRRRLGVRRDYESLYSLGVAFAAFAAAEAVHGSGFLAEFAAGLTIAALDIELCDCFLEYGETTSELALLFTFVLFGSSLIWSGFTILSPLTLLFAVVVLAIRPVAFLTSLAGSHLKQRGRLLIAWFGPRGLSTLLLVLLPVFGGLPGSDQLFAVCCLVVLLSVALHGGSLMLLSRRFPERSPPAAGPGEDAPLPVAQAVESPAAPLPVENGARAETLDGAPIAFMPRPPAARPAPAAPRPANGQAAIPGEASVDAERITIPEVQALQAAGALLIVLDARTERTYALDDSTAAGALRLDPEQPAAAATALHLPHDAWLVAFCA